MAVVTKNKKMLLLHLYDFISALVQDIQDKSSMQEFRISGFPEQKRKSALLESKLQEFEIEMERLSSRIEHLKSQNEVLNLTLTESKNHCDNLTVLIGKYESNHTAQALVISHLDHMMESFEALNRLMQDPELERVKVQKIIRNMDAFLRPDSGLALPSSSLGTDMGNLIRTPIVNTMIVRNRLPMSVCSIHRLK